MKMRIASYVEQSARWPQSGRHILAHFDEETIIVYQAYSPAIGNFAVEHQGNPSSQVIDGLRRIALQPPRK
jgi:hypothetical protein